MEVPHQDGEAARIVASHPITQRLKSLGVTDEQLASIRFRKTIHRSEFKNWSLTWDPYWGTDDGMPPADFALMRAYATLQYVYSENLPGSPDWDAAIASINQSELIDRAVEMQASIDQMAIREQIYKEQQSVRAKKRRGSVGDNNKPLSLIVEELILKAALEEGPSVIWPRLSGELDSAGVEIEELQTATGPAYRYEIWDHRKKESKEKQYKFTTFENAVSRVRRKAKEISVTVTR